MSRSSTLILLGILVILAPFSGLPISIRNLLAVIFGACVLGIGLSLRAREVRHAQALMEAPASGPEPVAEVFAHEPQDPPSGVSPI